MVSVEDGNHRIASLILTVIPPPNRSKVDDFGRVDDVGESSANNEKNL